MAGTTDVSEYPLLTEQAAIFTSPWCGYQIHVPAFRDNGSCVTVSTILSGPFVLPSGYNLASAVHKITMPQLAQPVIIEVEHCVSVDDKDSVKQDMCFATATINTQTKKFTFTPSEEAALGIKNEYASIEINESCLMCMLYKESE